MSDNRFFVHTTDHTIELIDATEIVNQYQTESGYCVEYKNYYGLIEEVNCLGFIMNEGESKQSLYKFIRRVADPDSKHECE